MSVTRNADGNKNGNVLKFAAPVALKEDYVRVNVWIGFFRQGSVAPLLNVFISLLVKVAYGSRRHLGSPKRFSDVFRASHGNAREIHFNQCFLYGSLASLVALNDGRFKGKPFKLRHPQVYISRSGRKVSLVMAGTVALALLVASVALGIQQALGFGIKQGIQGFLDTASYKVL